MSFPYKKNIEKSMKKFYDSLCEKNGSGLNLLLGMNISSKFDFIN
ncbi:hypothetical protein [Bathymodiolus platifrons methanotrophic gill symbiont]|nr:hypothetical protein [Bathymodiolus platifrons methanotrophic gill symbiont]